MKEADPSAVAGALFLALEERRWADAVGFIHPDSIAALHRKALARLDRDMSEDFTVEKIRRSDPDMPVEVAEYQVRRVQQQLRERPWHTYVFARVESAEEIRSMDPVELMIRAVEGSDPRVRAQLGLSRCAPGSACAAEASARQLSVSRAIIGHIVDTERAAHVIYRTRYFTNDEDKTPSSEAFRVLTLGWTEMGWRARNPDFVGAGMGVFGLGPLPAVAGLDDDNVAHERI